MAENTHPQIKDKIEEMLVSKERFEPEKAKEVMDSTWTDTPEDMAIKLTANVPLLFQRLKNEGVKVRNFTSYSRAIRRVVSSRCTSIGANSSQCRLRVFKREHCSAVIRDKAPRQAELIPKEIILC